MKLLCIVLVVLFASTSNQAAARDIFGFKKLTYEVEDQLNASIAGAKDAALALETKSNEDVRQRIQQIDELVQNAIDKLNADLEHQDEVAQNFINQFDRMRDDTLNRVSALIDKTFCDADKGVTEHFFANLGSLGRFLGMGKLRITAPVLYIGETDSRLLGFGHRRVRDFEVKMPFMETYQDVNKFAIEDRLGKATEKTPIASVLQSYLLMAHLAERTGCLTGDKGGAAVLSAHWWKRINAWKRMAGEGVTNP